MNDKLKKLREIAEQAASKGSGYGTAKTQIDLAEYFMKHPEVAMALVDVTLSVCAQDAALAKLKAVLG